MFYLSPQGLWVDCLHENKQIRAYSHKFQKTNFNTILLLSHSHYLKQWLPKIADACTGAIRLEFPASHRFTDVAKQTDVQHFPNEPLTVYQCHLRISRLAGAVEKKCWIMFLRWWGVQTVTPSERKYISICFEKSELLKMC